MVEFDPILGAVIVGLVGILLWIITNWHLVRTGRGLKADIDEKRAGTEAFVKRELSALKSSLQEELTGQDLGKRLDALQADFTTEIQGLEDRLQTVQIDARPLMEQVQSELIPAVQEKIENIKSSLLGKLGYTVKGLKEAGEAVAEVVGEQAFEQAGFNSEWELRLAQYGLDEEWMRTHKTAAMGFSFIKELLKQGQSVQVAPGGVPAGAKRIGAPPKGFG